MEAQYRAGSSLCREDPECVVQKIWSQTPHATEIRDACSWLALGYTWDGASWALLAAHDSTGCHQFNSPVDA